MCKNDCNGRNVTVNVCGCDDCGGVGGVTGRVTDTVLYDQVIDAVGTYTLADDINNYDDVFVLHETFDSAGSYMRQSFHMPVSCLSNSNLVCHGNSTVSRYVSFNITGNIFKALDVIDNYNIVKIIGRKFN